MKLSVCILAAGKGKRMYSALPKVLHRLAGKPLVGHVLDAAAAVTPTAPIVVYGHGGELLPAAFEGREIAWVEQREQLGTGHAVAQALPRIPADTLVVILYGDVPLLSVATLERLIAAAEPSGFSLLTVVLADPTGYGRIVRDAAGEVQRIVEHKDASPAERAIAEINTGIMAVRGDYLHRWLPTLGNDNAQGEYYLTDCVALAVADGIRVAPVAAANEAEVTGVNNRVQLAELERAHQQAQARALMEAGVTLADPARIDVRGRLECGRDCVIDINTVFVGQVKLGNNVVIGPNCVVTDSEIGDGVELLPNSIIDSARVGAGSRIGPFARLRPETELGTDVHIGNFVEVKKSRIEDGSKANHLAYIGDTEIGRNVNVGAGTITCNYDGANKHKTIIEDDVFIGSDTQLVAPVRVGRGSTIGAGTTVTDDVEPDRLVISRVRQKTISGWQRPRKPPKKS
ncbi:MAG: bifunctional UDP-N-acetylglucosamine diphosphorylase/glucosamine-1-phosphate N-acetyltransferase GlmU [Gammaproteobacteria bacterium]|nr:bifunctional UDP-N-acetylglucosamine diphosphorylase/glucosamine-1-phosphate N-acetyltransferase GlmU [Gammaproteobacteria bacterium]MBI5619004.1 bifunctional UDP-N-acetylglucosamine diphosphorylase/glucosamine-1-phosphate N-acetyltransferase GlmU [Gammaproteobacteria bacterium]